MKESSKTRLISRGSLLFYTGILVTLSGTAIQVYFFISVKGETALMTPEGLIWGGIATALGILMIVAGKIMTTVGRHQPENDGSDGF